MVIGLWIAASLGRALGRENELVPAKPTRPRIRPTGSISSSTWPNGRPDPGQKPDLRDCFRANRTETLKTSAAVSSITETCNE